MEDTRITFETAKLAKEKGFPQEPNKLKIPYYNYKGEFKGDVKDWLRKYLRNEDTSDVESVSAPTQSLLAKWLREVHNIEVLISIFPKQMREKMSKEKYCGYILNEDWNPTIPSNGTFCKTYKEALEAGLVEALKLI